MILIERLVILNLMPSVRFSLLDDDYLSGHTFLGQPSNKGPVIANHSSSSRKIGPQCYGRPLLQAWLLPDLNTIPNNCVGENSLKLSGLSYWLFVQASLVQIPSRSYISAMHLLIYFSVTHFVRKIGARPGLAKEP